MSRKKEIDAKDIEMLNILRTDAGITNKKLASALGLSESPTLKRHNNLYSRGYITDYQARIEFGKLGYLYKCLLSISIHERNYDSFCLGLKICEHIKSVYTIPASKTHNRLKMVVIAIAMSETQLTASFNKIIDACPFEVMYSSYPLSEIVKDDLSIPIRK